MYSSPLDPGLDYESLNGMDRFRLEPDDYYDDIWQEILVIDRGFQELQVEFEVVRKVINPMQAAALYWYSSLDAEETMCPCTRRHEILKTMRRSKSLSEYGIPDFKEFKKVIENIDPFSFYVFTEVLYRTNMTVYNGYRITESIEALDEKIKLLKKYASDSKQELIGKV